MSLAANLSKHH